MPPFWLLVVNVLNLRLELRDPFPLFSGLADRLRTLLFVAETIFGLFELIVGVIV